MQAPTSWFSPLATNARGEACGQSEAFSTSPFVFGIVALSLPLNTLCPSGSPSLSLYIYISLSLSLLSAGLASASVRLASVERLFSVNVVFFSSSPWVGRLRHISIFGFLGRIFGKKSPGVGAPKQVIVIVILRNIYFKLPQKDGGDRFDDKGIQCWCSCGVFCRISSSSAKWWVKTLLPLALNLYAVRLGSGPMFAILQVRFWTKFVFRRFLGQTARMFSFLPQNIHKMEARFRTNMAFLDPKLVQNLTFTLVQNQTFKNGPFYQNLLFKLYLKPL